MFLTTCGWNFFITLNHGSENWPIPSDSAESNRTLSGSIWVTLTYSFAMKISKLWQFNQVFVRIWLVLIIWDDSFLARPILHINFHGKWMKFLRRKVGATQKGIRILWYRINLDCSIRVGTNIKGNPCILPYTVLVRILLERLRCINSNSELMHRIDTDS